jgi:hypothetical protein
VETADLTVKLPVRWAAQGQFCGRLLPKNRGFRGKTGICSGRQR